MKATLSILGILVSLSSPALVQTVPAGFISKIEGNAYLKTGSQRVRLDSRRDLRRKLFAGDVIECPKPCSVAIKLFCSDPDNSNCNLKEIKSGEYTVPTPRVSTSRDVRKHEQAAQAYGISAGRKMGGLSPVYSPAPGSVVRPDRLVVRWTTATAMSSLTLKLQDVNGSTLWQQKVENGSSGALRSSALKQALIAYRSQRGTGPLILDVEDKNRSGIL